MNRKIIVIVLVLAAAVGCLWTAQASGQATSVPSQYQKLYSSLSKALDSFERQLSPSPTPNPRPIWGGELLVANANRGEELLQPSALAGTRLFLDRFQELGFKSVTISVNYPLFDPAFPRSDEYIAYYREVAREVRRRGLARELTDEGSVHP